MLSQAQVRLAKAAASGLVVTLSLFYLMSQLISGGQALKKSDDTENFIEFVRVQRQDNVQERKRQLPKKEVVQNRPPTPEKLEVAADQPQQNMTKMDIPKLGTSLKGSGPYLGPGGGGGGSGVAPIVRIEPQYPRSAAMQGIQGWVRLSFDITAMGTVDNVQVVDSSPKRVFDLEAKKALLKWKYKPRMEDGKAVPQKGEMVQLDFKLE